ncbi:MAG TPA: GNAT family N-acetyltransferase, partial [Nocardioides sp.]|uniref:GNAT family N-acetyltransferase n=1 Tax=Nocardioides sp. TaxID=35761 RepID=UPI002CD0F12B
REALAAELVGPGRTVLVAVGEQGPAGYAVLMVHGDVGDLLRLGVRPTERRRGLASALLAAARSRAQELGATRLLLEVSAGNQDAAAFYRAHGFTPVDRRPRYYRDGSDAVVLQLPLDS